MLFVVPVAISAQGNFQNYVKSVKMLDSEGTGKITAMEYYDGLGRLSEEVTDGLNTEGKCAYILHEYDGVGRMSKTWLPGIGGMLPEYMESADVAALSRTSNANDPAPFRLVTYDVFDRETGISGPGNAWYGAGKKAVRKYMLNDAGAVKKYVAYESSAAPVQSGFYAEGALNGEEVSDEDGKWVIVFTDFFGRKVLERRPGGVDTYFVYDSHGNLRFVLSPMYQDDSDVNKYAYEYCYDERMRCVSSRIPGCEPVYYWYDKSNRLAFLQDSQLREVGKCRFFLYDSFFRLTVQGVCLNSPTGCKSAEVRYNGSNDICNSGYSYTQSGGIQLINPEIEIVNYYDKYDYLKGPLFRQYATPGQMSISSPRNVAGLLTGRVTNSTDSVLMYNALYYNSKGLPVDVRQSYPSGRCLFTRTSYTFTGNPQVVTYELRSTDRTDSVVVSNTYSTDNDVLLSTDISYNGGVSHRVSSLRYDLLGRMAEKNFPAMLVRFPIHIACVAG